MTIKTIEITEREAIALLAVSGRVGGNPNGPRGSFQNLCLRVGETFQYLRVDGGNATYKTADTILERANWTLQKKDGVHFDNIVKPEQSLLARSYLDEKLDW